MFSFLNVSSSDMPVFRVPLNPPPPKKSPWGFPLVPRVILGWLQIFSFCRGKVRVYLVTSCPDGSSLPLYKLFKPFYLGEGGGWDWLP